MVVVPGRLPVRATADGGGARVAADERLLLVTLAVDLGNATNERRLVEFLAPRLDVRVHRFAAGPMRNVRADRGRVTSAAIVAARLRGAVALWREVDRARREGRTILFQNISPALYAWPVRPRGRRFVITDWTRKLFEPLVHRSLSPRWVTWVHRRVLRSLDGVLCASTAVQRSLREDYGMPESRLVRLDLPFDLETFHPDPRPPDGLVRLLFVAGDAHQKGGDALLEWFRAARLPGVDLTMVTTTALPACPGVRFVRGVRYGDAAHVALFQSHDLLVHPTPYDAFPAVLCEAAACGMAVATTTGALGARDVVDPGRTGVVCASRDELFAEVARLVADPARLRELGAAGRRLMVERFEPEALYARYRAALFG